jgi:predicted DNA-binding protein (MmcQ/YjbR family)
MSVENNSGEFQEAAVPQQPSENNLEAQQEQPQEKEQYVPLSALQSERAQRQQKEQEAQLLRDNLSLLQANMSYQQQPQQQKDEFDGLSENDVLTVGEAKKFMSQFNRQYQLSLEELRMTQKYPDYQDVVTRYLPEVLKTNPRLQDSLRSTQDYELAYYLAKNSDNYKKETKSRKVNADAARIVQNSQSTGSLSSMGSTSPISQTKRYKDMSDDDFMKEVHKNLGYS